MPKGSFFEVKNRLPEEIDPEIKNSMVFFIGNNAYHDTATVVFLKKYLNNGNSIFIASSNIPGNLIHNLWDKDSLLMQRSYYDSVVQTKFVKTPSKTYNFHYQFGKFKQQVPWTYIIPKEKDYVYQTAPFKELSHLDSARCNFIRLRYGKGAVYYFSTPILLTNYYLDSKQGYDFATQLFAETGNPETIYWDSFSHFYYFDNYSQKAKNPIEFIIENKELRWAWYVAIVGLVLFIIFRLKRRQAPIPYIKPINNTSIEYAKAVGILYYKNASHKDLAENMMKLFSHFIKNRYSITIKDKNSPEIKILSVQSGIKASAIDEIYQQHFKIKFNPESEASETISLHNALDNFYKNCK